MSKDIQLDPEDMTQTPTQIYEYECEKAYDAAKFATCSLCCAMVFTNQPHISNSKGYFHQACNAVEGKCYICKQSVHSTDMYAINASGHYHEKCIGEFKNVCGICNQNVYAKELYVTFISDTHFHSECMRNALDMCGVCGLEMYLPQKHIKLSEGEYIHRWCKIDSADSSPILARKLPRIDVVAMQVLPDPMPPVMPCPLVLASPAKKDIVPPEQDPRGICHICKHTVYRSEMRDKDAKGYFHHSCFFKKPAGIKDPIPPEQDPRGICHICKRMVYRSEMRDKDAKGYFHHLCFKKLSSMGVQAPIAKKPIVTVKSTVVGSAPKRQVPLSLLPGVPVRSNMTMSEISNEKISGVEHEFRDQDT